MKTYIVNMKNKRSVTNPSKIYGNGLALYVDDMGFLSLDGKNVYIPQGGRRAIKALVDDGLDNPGYSYVYP